MSNAPSVTDPVDREIATGKDSSGVDPAPGLLSKDLDYARVALATRAGALLMIFFQAAYLIADIHLAPQTANRTMPLHLANLVVGLLLFLVTWAPWFGSYWKRSAWSACAAVLVSTTAICLVNLTNEAILASVLVMLLGTATLAPWGWRWQACLDLVGLACLVSLAHVDPLSFYDWIAVFTTIALAHFSHELIESSRSLALKGIGELTDAEVRLRAKVAELERAERRASSSETKLNALLESAPDALIITDQDGKMVMASSAAEQMFGYARRELLGEPVEMLVPEQLRHKHAELRRAYSADPQSRPMGAGPKIYGVRKDGTRFPAEASLSPVETRAGRLIMVSIRDISIREEAEKRLTESEAALRKIFDASLDAITITDLAEGRFIDVNDEFLRRTGLTREEVIGVPYHELDLWPNHEQRDELARALVSVGYARNMEVDLSLKAGEIASTLISAVVLELGGIQCCLSIARDITAIKQTERALIEAREQAIAASRAKSEFLSVMSHEIRTPMNSILGMAELLAATETTPEQRHYVQGIVSNGDALIELINDILDLARIESGGLSLEQIDFDIEELVGKLAQVMAVRAQEKGLELAVRFAPDVPATLVGDSLRIRQILVNLLGNAVKFTREGEIVLSIDRCRTADRGAAAPERNESRDEVTLRFSVIDTGIGIAREKLGLIFSSFAQADSSTARNYGGSGLGLAIVQRLVELHHGEISVESEPGVGSCFSFTARFGVCRPEAAPLPEPVADLRGARILIADDADINRLILKEVLAQSGARTSEACDGEQALHALASAVRNGMACQIMLLDFRMPDLNGIEVLGRLKELRGDCGDPVVVPMLTLDDLKVEAARLSEFGISSYLVKPVRRSDLLSAISRAMDKSAPASPVPYLPHTREAAVTLPPMRILLADDSSSNQILVKAYLANSAVEVVEAEDGRIAVEKYQSGKYDVVLMDIRMPEMDGYNATRSIRAHEKSHHLPRTPIIALTASALADDVRQCMEAGCDFHVSKPVKRSVLLDAIAEAVKRPRDGDEGETRRPTAVVDKDLRDLVPEFLRIKRADITAVLDALRRGDYALVSRVAHQMKGDGAAYGFETVTDLGRALEDAMAASDAEAALRLAGELARYLERVEISYRSRVDSRG